LFENAAGIIGDLICTGP